LTAPCVAESEEDLNAFDVGVEPCADDEPPVLDEDVADLCDAVMPPVGVPLAELRTKC
jgi:hypothetical protein